MFDVYFWERTNLFFLWWTSLNSTLNNRSQSSILQNLDLILQMLKILIGNRVSQYFTSTRDRPLKIKQRELFSTFFPTECFHSCLYFATTIFQQFFWRILCPSTQKFAFLVIKLSTGRYDFGLTSNFSLRIWLEIDSRLKYKSLHDSKYRVPSKI